MWKKITKFGKGFVRVVFGWEKTNEAHFMKGREARRVAHSWYDGFVVDGYKQRLSLSDSQRHLAVIGGSGQGKTTRIVVANVLQAMSSLVITDPSREIYNLTSGHLKSRGFKVLLIDFSNPSTSLSFNPLECFSSSSELAHIIIRSANSGGYQGTSRFWNESAEQIVALLIDILVALDKPEYLNLPNVRHMLNYVLHPGFVRFVNEEIHDEKIHAALRGYLSASESMRQCFVTIAMSSLKLLNNEDLARMMMFQDIDLASLRKEKTALFVAVPSEKLEQYSFLVNLFYAQLFQTFFEDMSGDPVTVILDEAGHMAIPNFASIMTTVRKYKVSIMAIYQAKTQLEELYGKNQAHTILSGGFYTKIVLPGLDVETAEYVSRTIGQAEKKGRMAPLVSADRIRVRESGHSLLLAADKEPMEVTLKPYYETSLLPLTKKKPTPYPCGNQELVQYLDLEKYILEPGE